MTYTPMGLELNKIATSTPVDGNTITMYNNGKQKKETICTNVQLKQVWF